MKLALQMYHAGLKGRDGDRILDAAMNELIARLREIARESNDDPETAHADADVALIRFIDNEEVTEAFRAIRKWYA